MKKGKSSEQLWQKVLSNDLSALEMLYKRFHSPLFLYAQKLSNNSAIAEDAVQDAFLYLWQHRSQIGIIKSLRFYLFKSVRNATLKLIKKQNALRNLEEAQGKIQLIIHPSELVLHDDSEERKRKINTALNELSNRQREIIFLKFYNNLDYEEIAQLLEINYQSVVNHMHKAIQKLRKLKSLEILLQ